MKKIIYTFVFICVVCSLSVVLWLNYPILKSNQSSIRFRILVDSSINKAVRQIVSSGVPLNQFLFVMLVRISARNLDIKSGNYILQPGVTPLGLLRQLLCGDNLTTEVLTIIEGWNFHQMRHAIAKHQGLKHDTILLSDQALLSKITTTYKSPEGLFFPSTYIFFTGVSDLQIYRQAFDLMQKKLHIEWNKRDPTVPYTSFYDALIMASIIEKETGRNDERSLVAGVFINRLKIGMPLQTDPTIIYGMGKNYRGDIQKRDLLTDTPYNTYTRKGMPPTPIALPGIASLIAALNPNKTQALYFVSRGDGTSYFSKNLTDHNRAVHRYQK